MSLDATVLPSELLFAPQPLIGFYGLDIAKNSVHKTIWDAFSSNRKADRPAVQYKLIPTNYEFPVAKPKKASYEWYHPKGILKRNWMLKHLHVLPAVVVVFEDLEWNDPQWAEKQVHCGTMIQKLRNGLQERNTKIALVLLQKSSSSPQKDDLLASEMTSNLVSFCGISTKVLFTLSYTDHLTGQVMRLESSLFEIAQSYYTQMAKRIRGHRDQLTAAHITLKIRHQFKLGFVAEMRLDYNTTSKHYSQAYATLEEIRIVDTNCLEIKVIAGFLNYKICRLMFKLNAPRDAINHFISHIEKYKNRVGFKELLFEHYAWLSTQHNAFAELFCEAIKNGLPALQTQHPGIYFHKAAEYTAKRKEAFIQSLSLSPTEPSSPDSMPNTSLFFSEFFGVRTLKTGEPFTEQHIITLVQENERNFNHSAAIITFLGQAMAQFKIYKCLRFRKKLAIDMAEEYYKCGDHSKALTLFSLMLPDYRQDKWNMIFSDVLLKTLRCAFLSASVSDFICCSIEMLSQKINYDQNDRIIVLENLWKVFQNVPPVPQSQITPEIRASWENSLVAFKSPIVVDLDKLTDLLECVVSFDKSEMQNDGSINIKLYIKLLTNVPIKIRKMHALITDGNDLFKFKSLRYSAINDLVTLRASEADESELHYENFDHDLKLEPQKFYKFLFSIRAQEFMENVQLQVSRIEIEMGTDKTHALLVKNTSVLQHSFKYYNRFKNFSDNIMLNPFCYIKPTFHLQTQSNLSLQTMLVNEYFKITTSITNPFNIFLQNVGISINIPHNLKNKVFLAMDKTPDKQKLLSHIQIDVGELSEQGTTIVSYYVFSLIETKIELQQKTWYQIEVANTDLNKSNRVHETNNVNSPVSSATITDKIPNRLNSGIRIDYIDDKRIKKTKEEFFTICCAPEFSFTGRFYTLSRQSLSKVYKGENFLFRVNIEIEAPCDLEILETYFICDHNLIQSPYSFKRKKYTNTYKHGETIEDVIQLRTNASLINWVTAKDYITETNLMDKKLNPNIFEFKNRQRKTSKPDLMSHNKTISSSQQQHLNKTLLSKIPTNTTIIGGNNSNALTSSQNSNLSSSLTSDDGKLPIIENLKEEHNSTTGGAISGQQSQQQTKSSRMIFHKALDSIQSTGPFRGFMKGVLTNDSSGTIPGTGFPIFGLYCIKWMRTGSNTDENESKFLITGIEIEDPPLNIYCEIEENIFVHVPMTFRIVLKNPSSKVLYLITTLSSTENFMTSGHKELNISIFGHSEKELVFNLYPLKVGWQTLPELTLEYNTQIDPNKDDMQKAVLCQLVQRSMPKKVFILPAVKKR